MIRGYARASTKDLNLDMQIDALKKYCCERFQRALLQCVSIDHGVNQ